MRNMQMLTPFMHRKGFWRVRLNATCEILESPVPAGKAGPPQQGEVSFRVRGDGSLPEFGALDRLTPQQGARSATATPLARTDCAGPLPPAEFASIEPPLA